jgi:hypothetical protein
MAAKHATTHKENQLSSHSIKLQFSFLFRENLLQIRTSFYANIPNHPDDHPDHPDHPGLPGHPDIILKILIILIILIHPNHLDHPYHPGHPYCSRMCEI